MHSHDRAVDHLHLAVVRFDDGMHQAIQDASHAPAVEAIVDRRVEPIALAHIALRRAGAKDKEDAVQDAAVVLWLAASAPMR